MAYGEGNTRMSIGTSLSFRIVARFLQSTSAAMRMQSGSLRIFHPYGLSPCLPSVESYRYGQVSRHLYSWIPWEFVLEQMYRPWFGQILSLDQLSR